MIALAIALTACGPVSTSVTGVSLSSANYTVPQTAGSVSVTVVRTGNVAAAASVAYSTANGTAVAGSDYTATSGTLHWAENDSTPRTVVVPISGASTFSGSKSFQFALTNPSTATAIGNPGSATVAISGGSGAAQASVQLAATSFSVAQGAGSVTVAVNRSGSASGAISVGYYTSDGTAAAGSDYTSSSGTLQWADGDSSAKLISIPVSNASPFSGNKSFTITLMSASGATLGSPNNGAVTIVGSLSPVTGTLQLSAASYSVPQNSGSVTITVDRVGGSSGAASVAYATADGSAVAGTDYTATSGTLQWTSGDVSPKTISVPVSSATAFAGTRTFTLALYNPGTGTYISYPGSAAVTIAGAATPATGSLQFAVSSYAVAQNGGSATLTVDRVGGTSGAISVAYATANGSAVAGTDYTATHGTLQWADGDGSPKTISVAISNATPFSGTKSFTVAVSNATGGAGLGSPSSVSVSISGSASAGPGALQLSSSSYGVSQSGGSVTVTVNRTGGSTGAISVAYATTDGTAVAGTDYTASSGTLQWADGDASSKTVSIPVSNASPYSGTKSFTVAVSAPAGGATLSTPTSATVTILGSSGGGVTWVYYGGVMNWGGDWSFAVSSVNYRDTAGVPVSGAYDIAVASQQWGGWQPYVSGNCNASSSSCFDTTPYKYLMFSVKPTVANQQFGVSMHSANDTPDGPGVPDISAYCSGGSSPPVGQWETCKIPMSAFALTDTMILKFALQDQSGLSSNLWYVDNVGFSAN